MSLIEKSMSLILFASLLIFNELQIYLSQSKIWMSRKNVVPLHSILQQNVCLFGTKFVGAKE